MTVDKAEPAEKAGSSYIGAGGLEETVDRKPPDVPSVRKARKPKSDDLGPIQVLEYTGLSKWQWDAGTGAGLIPLPDVGGRRWSIAAADTVLYDEVVAVVGTEAPIGGHKAADRLAERTGLDVQKSDVDALTDAGLLTVAGWYKGWPLWHCHALDAVDVDALGAVVAERQAWIAGSVSRWDAPAYLGWRRGEFARVAELRGLTPGRLDRYAKADLDALAGDEDLAEQVRLDRLLMAHQAAAHLEIRETDFRWLLAADLVAPQKYTSTRVSRYRWVDVPLYRVGDLEALREHPDVDWEAVRAVKPGEPSPLRHLARRPVDRAAVIRRGVAELGGRYGVEVWAWWNNNAGIWEADFERRDGGPTVTAFRKAIAEHPHLCEHQESIAVATEAGAALRWARAMREPGAAVILDTETTGLVGYVVEIAVLDAATGEVLLDTLVNPGCPVEPGASWVHGISDEEVADAPPLADVLPRLLEVTAGRTVLAYNAEFDYSTLVRHAGRDGLNLAHLTDERGWSCLMNRRSAWLMRHRWLPLGGAHRALGDCRTAFEVLAAMTAPANRPAVRR
jgi:hypothetical protein